MNHQDIERRVTSVAKSLGDHRLSRALDEIDSLATTARAPYSVKQRIEQLRNDYGMMQKFALLNAVDPERDALYADMCSKAISLAESLRRSMLLPDYPSLYFSTLRYELTHKEDTIDKLIASYRSEMENGADASKLEAQEQRIFRRIWVNGSFSPDEQRAIIQAIGGSFDTSPLPYHVRRLFVSAILLGSLEFFSEVRLLMLADIYETTAHEDFGAEVMVALLIALMIRPGAAAGNGRSDAGIPVLSHRLKTRLDSLAELPGCGDDVRMSFMQIIKSADTERISAVMNNEVIPELMKMRPEINRKLRELTSDSNIDPNNPESLQEALDANPEWEDMFANTPIAKKLKEFSDLQMDGADVMMSTFAPLKSFSFFNEISNWFMAFHKKHSVAQTVMGKKLGTMLSTAPLLCNGDKFSLILLAETMGGTRYDMMLSQLSAQAEAMRKDVDTSLNPESERRATAARLYVQDLYRFFKLFRRKGEFRDPFAVPINPLSVPLLGVEMNDAENLSVPAEFYFRRKLYEPALALFKHISNITVPTAEIYQKIGFALEKLGRPDEALENYRLAELIKSDSVWTLKKIARLLVNIGQEAEALGYWDRLENMQPDDLNILRAKANTLLKLKRFDEALTLYYKLDFLSPDDKVSRAMAWCFFMTGKYDKSRNAYNAILSRNHEFTATDLLNLGHLDMVDKHYDSAAELYSRAIKVMGMEIERFENEMASDRETLITRAGVDPLMLDITIDTAISRSLSRQ